MQITNSYRTEKYYRAAKGSKKLKKLFSSRWKHAGKNKEFFSLAWLEPQAYNDDQRKHFNYLYDFL